jgi:hypothetical protein
MASKNQPDRWEATLLAVVMAVAGAPFLFDRLGSLMRLNALTPLALHNFAPMLLVAVGAVVLLVEQGAIKTDKGDQDLGERHEL